MIFIDLLEKAAASRELWPGAILIGNRGDGECQPLLFFIL
jgi:hypothetical protein